MLNAFIKAFEVARKSGTIDTKVHQSQFTFSYPEFGINNVKLLLQKKQMDRRFKVDVLMNIDDRRNQILPNDSDLARVHAILQVTLPIAEYDVTGHINRLDARRPKIEQIFSKMKEEKLVELKLACGANEEVVAMVKKQIFGRNSNSYLNFLDELLNSDFYFGQIEEFGNFSATIFNACCMIVKHFNRTETGRIEKLPGKYYFYYISDRNIDKLPKHIAASKKFLSELMRYYGNFKFFNFCSWMAELCLVQAPALDRDITCTLEEERIAKRTMKFDKSNERPAPSDKKFDRKANRDLHDSAGEIVPNAPRKERDEFATKKKPPRKKIRPAAAVKDDRPGIVSMGAAFGDILDSALPKDAPEDTEDHGIVAEDGLAEDKEIREAKPSAPEAPIEESEPAPETTPSAAPAEEEPAKA